MHTKDEVVLDDLAEDRLPLGRTFAFGFQHLLALTGIWLFPILLGQALALTPDQVSYMIQACFFTCGIVTILQSSTLLKLPVVQGPTAAFFTAILATGLAHGGAQGLGVAFGSMFAAGLIAMLLTIPIRGMGLMGRLTKFIATPLVFGTILLIISASLASFGLSGWFGAAGTSGYGLPSFLVGGATALVMLLCMIFGRGTFVAQAALLLAVVFGTVVAWCTGVWSIPDFASYPLMAAPKVLPFGFAVSPPVVLLMLVAFFHAGAEATGMYALLGSWNRQEVSPDRVNRGLFSEFLGCSLGALFGGLGTTSYPENVSIIRISKVASRFVTLTAGIIALALSFFPMLSLFIAGLPGPVLAAAPTILFGVIGVSGIQMLSQVEWDEFNIAVVAPAFIIALGAAYIPEDILERLSPAAVGFLKPIMLGVIMLLLLNVVVNHGLRPRLEANSPHASAHTPTSAETA